MVFLKTLFIGGLLSFFAISLDGCQKSGGILVEKQESKTPKQGQITDYQPATFAAGCFWGVEYVYQNVDGVRLTDVGFMGGNTENPSYKEVCYGDTNHAEVVHLRFDPDKVSYEKLVRIFFKVHDPTTLNRQGPDVGTQYRSAIFYHNDQQLQVAKEVMAEFDQSGHFAGPIVTQIVPAARFYKAEDYHQRYFDKNPNRQCHIINLEEVLKDN